MKIPELKNIRAMRFSAVERENRGKYKETPEATAESAQVETANDFSSKEV